jgi:uncharacterized protein involved in exopolysaccharide biosynthesis
MNRPHPENNRLPAPRGRKIQAFIHKEKKLLLAGLLVGLALSILYVAAFYVPMYGASARLYIRNITTGNVIAAYGNNNQVRSESGYSNPLFNYLEILKSEKLSSRLYKPLQERYPRDLARLGVTSPAKWRSVYGDLLQAKVVPSTDIIKVDFKWSNPATAEAVFNRLLDEYKRTALDIRHVTAHRQAQYLDERLEKLGGELRRVRRELKDYSIRNQAIDPVRESDELTRARIDLEKQAQILKSQARFSESKFSDYSRQLNIKNAEHALKAVGLGTDPYLVKLNQDLAMAQQKKARLDAGLTELHPEMRAITQEIDKLKQGIAERQRKTLGEVGKNARELYDAASVSVVTAMAQVQADSVSQKAQLEQLLRGIDALRTEERAIPLKRMEMKALEQRESTLANAYDQMMQKQMEARLRADQIVIDSNIETLDQPGRPHLVLIELLMKLITLMSLGVMSGLTAAWIKNDIDDRWMDTDEIEAVTGKRVLGVIPWVRTRLRSIDGGDTERLHLRLKSSYESVVQNLARASFTEEAQVLAILSTRIRRTGSPVIRHIGRTLAALGRSTLIINTHLPENGPAPGRLTPGDELDLPALIEEINRRHRLAQPMDAFELDARIERLERLCAPSTNGSERGEKNVVHSLSTLRKDGGDVFEQLASRGFQTLINRLRTRYEFILIDTPAQSAETANIQAITEISDGAVILSALDSSRQDLLALIRTLEKSGTKVLGVIPREQPYQRRFRELETRSGLTWLESSRREALALETGLQPASKV